MEINIQTYVVPKSELQNSMNQIIVSDSEMTFVKEIASLSNVYHKHCTCDKDNLIIEGKINGYSLNTFDKFTDNVYISREDNIYLQDGNLQLKFCFSQHYTCFNDVPTLLPGQKIEVKPIYKSGNYESRNIFVVIMAYEDCNIYKIIEKC